MVSRHCHLVATYYLTVAWLKGSGADAWAGKATTCHPHSVAQFSSSSSSKNDKICCPSLGRREILSGILTSSLLIPFQTNAAETVGKDPDCNDSSCIGVWDGMLADCPHGKVFIGAGCVSSQDDTPGIFSEPWDYSEADSKVALDDYEYQIRLIRSTVELVAGKRGDKSETLLQKDRYLRMLLVDGKSGEKSIGEFYVTPNDTTIQYRLGSLDPGNNVLRASSLRNIERSEVIRKELRYLKIPVLRNRKRSLVFFESDLDKFGPGSASLGPPEDLQSEEIDGGRLSDNVDPKLKIDFTQQFPFAK